MIEQVICYWCFNKRRNNKEGKFGIENIGMYVNIYIEEF